VAERVLAVLVNPIVWIVLTVTYLVWFLARFLGSGRR
jgi:hypothetical protein